MPTQERFVKLVITGLAVGIGMFGCAGVASAAPANDAFADAQSLSIGDKVNGSTIGATTQAGEPPIATHPHVIPAHTVWFKFTSDARQRLWTWMCMNEGGPPSGHVSMHVYSGTELTDLEWVEGGGCSTSFAVEPGTTWLRVDSQSGAEGNFTLNLWNVARPGNDDRANAALLPSEFDIGVDGTTAGATPEPGESWLTGERAHASVWYRWIAPTDRHIALDGCGFGFIDPVATIYRSADGQRPGEAFADNGCDTEEATYPPTTFNVIGGAEYLISVDNKHPYAWIPDNDGDFTLYIDDYGPPVFPPPLALPSPVPLAPFPAERSRSRKKCPKGTRRIRAKKPKARKCKPRKVGQARR